MKQKLQQQNVIYHHWVHKRTHAGRCKHCTKTIGNSKLPFSSKEIQAITCSWCKVSYHNKENCYSLSTLTEPCTLGIHRESILPPSWIIKFPTQPQLVNGDVGGAQIHELGDYTKPDNLIDFSLASSQVIGFKTVDERNNNKENSAISNNNISNSLVYSSSTNLIPDSSSNSPPSINNTGNTVILDVNNENDNRKHPCDRQTKEKTGDDELLMDPSALLATDLSLINQSQSPQLKERQQHVQDGLAQAKRQRDSGDPYQHPFFHDQHCQISPAEQNAPDFSNLMIDMQQQHQNQLMGLGANVGYPNFRIVPQPIQGAPSAGSKPVLVFVNPRSGGNEGAKMMQKFNWLLNPRQIFDLIESGGPRPALELYRNVPNLRILTIGGDGTASWILSTLDEVGLTNKIPVAVLPLGTGNDLARALGWGSGNVDEPANKILTQLRDSEIVYLDRWNLTVERNHAAYGPIQVSEFSSGSIANGVTGGGKSAQAGGGSLNPAGSMVSMDTGSPSLASSPSYFGTLPASGSGGNNTTASTASAWSIADQQLQLNNCDINMNANAAANNGMTNNSSNSPKSSKKPKMHIKPGCDRLPMDVINNYFSVGVDAHIALEFHTAREAHPERFSSRLRNRMFYGQAGGKDLLKRRWKDLAHHVKLYCDGQDMTNRLKDAKAHSVLFLNISSYGGGTRPWPPHPAFSKPRTDDGLIEVIAMTTYQLPLLQAGGHGIAIAQCRSARIVTTKTIPMQVDGEPCKLLPSIVSISFKNRVCMLSKAR